MTNWNGIRYVELWNLGDYVIVLRHDSAYEQGTVRVEGIEEASELRDKRNGHTVSITGAGNGLATFSPPSLRQVNQPRDGTIDAPIFGNVDGKQAVPAGNAAVNMWHNGVIEKTEVINGVPTITRCLGGRERHPGITVTIHPNGPKILVDNSPMPYVARM